MYTTAMVYKRISNKTTRYYTSAYTGRTKANSSPTPNKATTLRKARKWAKGITSTSTSMFLMASLKTRGCPLVRKNNCPSSRTLCFQPLRNSNLTWSWCAVGSMPVMVIHWVTCASSHSVMNIWLESWLNWINLSFVC